jgi:hypothetical protein
MLQTYLTQKSKKAIPRKIFYCFYLTPKGKMVILRKIEEMADG